MKVLFAVWECAPFIKVGGLGDVAHSLSRALKELGVDIRVVIPHYKAVRTGRQKRLKLGSITIKYAGRSVKVKLFKIMFLDAQVPVYLLQNRRYFDIPGLDTWPVFDLAVAKIVADGIEDWKPEIVHCNDNHCAFIPLLIKQQKLPVKTLLTIHSLLHQRRSPEVIADRMGLNRELFKILRWESKKKRIVGLLEAIIHADRVNTVSPSYAKEILTEEYGAGLDDILREQPEKITGIINGIDHDLRNPENNKSIKNYTWETVADGKGANKRFLQKKLGFITKSHIPLIGFVGRLDPYQKGIDLLHKMLLRQVAKPHQFVILGEGQVEWEEKFALLASFYPKNIAYLSKYSDELATQVYAGCDFILVPSRFEPCCLVQMNAMRYGAIPVARATGGLKDTIRDGEDGFLFDKATSADLEKALYRAIKVYKEHPFKIHTMRQNAMARDFSWRRSANKYLEVYQDLLK